MASFKAEDAMVGVRQNQMIINGVAYCNFCWTPRSRETADDDSLCACIKEPVISCEDCSNVNDKPCLFCHPDHFTNYKVAMAILDELLKPYDEKETQHQSLPCGLYFTRYADEVIDHCLQTPCAKHIEFEDCHCKECKKDLDCIQRERDYEYQRDYNYDRYYY